MNDQKKQDETKNDKSGAAEGKKGKQGSLTESIDRTEDMSEEDASFQPESGALPRSDQDLNNRTKRSPSQENL